MSRSRFAFVVVAVALCSVVVVVVVVVYLFIYILSFLKPRKQCFYSSKRRGERREYEWLTDVVMNVRRTSERTSARVSERVNRRVRTSGRTCARACVRLHVVHWPRARTYENKVDWSRSYFCTCKALQY